MNNYVVVRQPNDHIVLGVNEDYVIEIPMEERDVQLVCTEKRILNFILFIVFLMLAGSTIM